jgi:PAS domain-containing protein
MATPPDPGDPATSEALAAVLATLASAGPALAVVGADGCLAWCTQAFADAVAGVPAADLQGTDAATWLGVGPVGWQVETRDAGHGIRVLQLQPEVEQAALRRQVADLQERLSLMQAFCNAGVFERDPVTMKGRWDEQMYRIFGLPVPPPGTPAPPYEEVSQLYVQDGRRLGGFRNSLDRPGPHVDRVRLRRPDGEIRYLHSQWKVIHDAQGRAVRVIGVNRDDTEVYQLAREAKALREELDLVLQLGDIGLWRHDLQTGLLYLDERASRLAEVPFRPQGITRDEARAHMHPDDLAMVQAGADETLRTGAWTDQAIRYRRPDGGIRHVLSRRTLAA